MVNSWITAIKEFNQDKKYLVPKKGSVEYDAIRLIQTKNKEMVRSVPVKKTVKAVKGDGIKEV